MTGLDDVYVLFRTHGKESINSNTAQKAVGEVAKKVEERGQETTLRMMYATLFPFKPSSRT